MQKPQFEWGVKFEDSSVGSIYDSKFIFPDCICYFSGVLAYVMTEDDYEYISSPANTSEKYGIVLIEN